MNLERIRASIEHDSAARCRVRARADDLAAQGRHHLACRMVTLLARPGTFKWLSAA